MAGVRVEGMWCIFHPLSQTGEPGGEVGMVSEEEFHTKKEQHFYKRPSRPTIPETAAGKQELEPRWKLADQGRERSRAK